MYSCLTQYNVTAEPLHPNAPRESAKPAPQQFEDDLREWHHSVIRGLALREELEGGLPRRWELGQL